MALGKLLIAVGLAIALLGGLVYFGAQWGIKPFRLPGDIIWRGKNTTIYLPIATSILLSLLLTLLLSFFGRR